MTQAGAWPSPSPLRPQPALSPEECTAGETSGQGLQTSPTASCRVPDVLENARGSCPGGQRGSPCQHC